MVQGNVHGKLLYFFSRAATRTATSCSLSLSDSSWDGGKSCSERKIDIGCEE